MLTDYLLEVSGKGSVLLSFERFGATLFLTGVLNSRVWYVNVLELKCAKTPTCFHYETVQKYDTFSNKFVSSYGPLFQKKLPYDLNT